MQALANSGLTQYPDKKLYKAATLLTPEERPKVPVKTMDLPNDDLLEGKFDKDKHEIRVNRSSSYYKKKDPALLAAALAHEAEHARRVGQPDELAEAPAYQRQLDVLKRLNYKDERFMNALRLQIEAMTKQEKK